MADRQGPPRPRVRKSIGYTSESDAAPKPAAQKQTEEAGKGTNSQKVSPADYRSDRGRPPAPRRPVQPDTKVTVGGVSAAVVENQDAPRKAPVRVDMSERIAERDRARRRLVLTRLGIFLLVAALLAGTTWLVAFSRVFAFESGELDVTGLQSGEITETVLPIVTEYQGTPLLRVSTGRIKEALLKEPVVADVVVKRSWPNSLSITVERRKPAAIAHVGEQSLLIGADGVALGAVTGEEDLPAITILSGAERVEEDAVTGLEVWEVLPVSLQEQVNTLEVRRGQVSLTLVDGARVVWGDSSSTDLKAEVLEILIDNRPASTYDVTDPARPVTK